MESFGARIGLPHISVHKINVVLYIHFSPKFRKTLVQISVLKLLEAQQCNPSL